LFSFKILLETFYGSGIFSIFRDETPAITFSGQCLPPVIFRAIFVSCILQIRIPMDWLTYHLAHLSEFALSFTLRP